MDGLLIIDKPRGLTSADVVRRVKRALHAKIGHLGTLDPFATGVLPICVGQGTKLAPFLSVAGKRYEGTIRLGEATDSGDLTGAVVDRQPLPQEMDLLAVAQRFLGESKQIPPMYSALKRAGTPLYKLARRGEVVEREPRTICIESLSLRAAAPDSLTFEVACSKGTYIRVLAEDIARVLGTAGHLIELRRTGFGNFDIAAAVRLEEITEPNCEIRLIGLCEALQDIATLVLSRQQEIRAGRGERGLLRELALGPDVTLAKLVAADGALLAVVCRDDGADWSYARVFERAASTSTRLALPSSIEAGK